MAPLSRRRTRAAALAARLVRTRSRLRRRGLALAARRARRRAILGSHGATSPAHDDGGAAPAARQSAAARLVGTSAPGAPLARGALATHGVVAQRVVRDDVLAGRRAPARRGHLDLARAGALRRGGGARDPACGRARDVLR